MTRVECVACASDIEDFYDVSADIIEDNSKLLELASIAGNRFLTPGRVVILKDGVR